MTKPRRYRTLISDSALWADFRLRPGDVVISTPPKSGTTWMQMLCALLVFDTAEFHRPLTEISPWLDAVTYDATETRALLEAQRHRRFIKTHTPLDGLPSHTDVSYVCVARDPRDVMLSFENAVANISPEAMAAAAANAEDFAEPEDPPEDPLERFRLWVDAELAEETTTFGMTLANVVHHLQTFWDRRHEPQVALFHYRDLKADLPGQLRCLAEVLSIERSAERIEELAAAAGFESMRRRADDLAPGVDAKLWRSNRDFFRSGSSGQWRQVLDAPAVAHYERRLSELASPDLAEWLRAG